MGTEPQFVTANPWNRFGKVLESFWSGFRGGVKWRGVWGYFTPV